MKERKGKEWPLRNVACSPSVVGEGSGWTGLPGCSILGTAVSLFSHLL